MHALQLNNKKPLTIPCTQQEEGDRHYEQNPENSAQLARAQIFDYGARHLAMSHNKIWPKPTSKILKFFKGFFFAGLQWCFRPVSFGRVDPDRA
jgi:hypothetical protein